MILEDDPCDIIEKSMHGQAISLSSLSKKTGLSEHRIQAVLDGDVDAEAIHRISNPLGLSASALLSLDSYIHEVTPPKGLYRFTTDYGHLGVNAYLITSGTTATIFDTGSDAEPILEFTKKHQLQIEALYITHRHPDHTACVDSFKNTPIIYPERLNHGEILKIGTHQLKAFDVSGHASPAKAFFFDSLETPVCICGDSLFAGSMGKTANQRLYQQALQTASGNILTLPDNTIICPGHGPLTTVSQEQRNNAFFSDS